MKKRNPIAKAVRKLRPQVVPDKRKRANDILCDAELKESQVTHIAHRSSIIEVSPPRSESHTFGGEDAGKRK